jgi:low temperature requirement protein LtrA
VGRRSPDTEAPLLAAPPQSWLELFYDLVFVAAILVLSSAYSADSRVGNVVWLAVVFGMVWATWLATTLLTNRVRLAGTFLRSLLVAQMLLIMTLALVGNSTLEDDTTLSGVVFAGAMVVLAAMYRHVGRHAEDLRPALRSHTVRCLAVGGVLAVAAFVSAGVVWVPVFVAALLVLVLPGPRGAYYEHLDSEHLRHRFGEFTIIMIGESFVKIGLVATEAPLGDLDLVVLPLAFVLAFSIWWLYFTDVPATELPPSSRGRTGWMLLHFPLHLGIVALAVGIAKLLLGGLDHATHAGPGGVRFLPVPLVLISLSLAGFNLLTDGPQHRRRALIHLTASLAMGLTGVLAYRFDELPPELTAGLFTAIMAATAVATRRFAVAATSPG